jgi:hypothetical protein
MRATIASAPAAAAAATTIHVVRLDSARTGGCLLRLLRWAFVDHHELLRRQRDGGGGSIAVATVPRRGQRPIDRGLVERSVDCLAARVLCARVRRRLRAGPRPRGLEARAGGERLERARQLDDVPVAFGGLARDRLVDDGREQRALGARVLLERLRRARRDLHDQRRVVLAIERKATRERLVEDGAERIHVAARIDVLRANDLLGRHVVRRADRHAALGEAVALGEIEDLRDTEVEHLCERSTAVVRVAHEEVVGLEVAVDHARAVRGAHALHRREEDLRNLGDLEASVVHDRAQGAPDE